MIEIIKSSESVRRQQKLERIRARSVSLDAGLMRDVAAIIEEVKARGDRALIDFTARFDGVTLDQPSLRVDEESLRRSAARTGAGVLRALRESIKRVRAFHEHERERSWQIDGPDGVRLGQRLSPIERAGLYVPGGTASYPSSVVMNVVPALVAGVERIVVVTPPRTLQETPAVAAALLELGVTEAYRVGGAQAIAALAHGTETIPRVDKITGPGNRYVAAAKKLVFGAVGIDSIAGPSEVVVIADDTARADYVAADLLAQAEHGEDASAILLTTSERLAVEVAEEIARQAADLPRRSIVEASLADYGAIFILEEMNEVCALANSLAPEHLEIIARDEEAIAERIRHAGAIFFGPHTPEAVGDYFAGPNHVLPTGGAARFSSALGVYDFVRRTSLLRYSRAELARTARDISELAHAEGLEAHARSALIRLEEREESEAQSAEPDDKAAFDFGLIKPGVRGLKAYTLSPDRASVKINQNENPWDVPGAIKEETFARMARRAWSRYPDFAPVSLHERLARFAGWRPDGIIAGNGSNELIQALLMVTVGTGTRVLINEPTFALYRQITTVLGGEVLSLQLKEDLTYDAEGMLRAIAEQRPEVIIICSPNNPTGCVIEEDELVQCLRATRGLIAVDEAYFEFAGQSALPLLDQYENLVVLRTFSKAMAMAALRVGYLMAAPALAREIGKAVLPYNLNALSQTAAEVAAEMYWAELGPLVGKIVAERERLYEGLQAIEGLWPIRSRANFMVVRSAIDPRTVFQELLRRDILIRDVSSYPMLRDYFRLSTGTPAENDLLLAALREIFTERLSKA